MHELKIDNRQIYLDGTKLKGVSGYELKRSAESNSAELTVRLYVKDSQCFPGSSDKELHGDSSGNVASGILASP